MIFKNIKRKPRIGNVTSKSWLAINFCDQIKHIEISFYFNLQINLPKNINKQKCEIMGSKWSETTPFILLSSSIQSNFINFIYPNFNKLW